MLERSRPYYLYDQPTDMRKSFHTLAPVTQPISVKLGLLSGAGFVFINRRKTHLKVLMWEGDGLSLYYKRLERGTFEHPHGEDGFAISYEKLLLILQGIETKKVVKRKRFSLGQRG
ncbi:MAG: IS66 family insertion sequence element accessory protein TnpB [Saprospirales bacterium]|nr:IS66 family insertion sequence element accessory protein TnpB [Saprospirales bacterium]